MLVWPPGDPGDVSSCTAWSLTPLAWVERPPHGHEDPVAALAPHSTTCDRGVSLTISRDPAVVRSHETTQHCMLCAVAVGAAGGTLGDAFVGAVLGSFWTASLGGLGFVGRGVSSGHCNSSPNKLKRHLGPPASTFALAGGCRLGVTDGDDALLRRGDSTSDQAVE